MRHGNKVNALGRQYGHRKAMMRNLASSLILNKRIVTTLAKAKELRKYVEPVITKSKTQTTASRRDAFRYLQQKEAVHELFTEVSTKVAERNGGYTRIIKMGNRLGDNAELAMIELVDYNELYSQSKGNVAGKKSRRRRGGNKASTQTEVAAIAENVVEDTIETANEIVETVAEEVEETVTDVVEEAVEEIEDSIESGDNDETKEANSEDEKKD